MTDNEIGLSLALVAIICLVLGYMFGRFISRRKLETPKWKPEWEPEWKSKSTKKSQHFP